MSEEELKRMEDFVNATLKPDKSNEYRLGYEDALRRCYYFVDNLEQRIDKAIEYIEKYRNDKTNNLDRRLEKLLEILGDKVKEVKE